MEQRKCRVCGCTDDDCSQCIEKTGERCHWVEDDLCSACQNVESEKGEMIVGKEEETETRPEFHNPTNFFTELFPLVDGIDVTIKIKRKNGRITLSFLPETTSTLSPVIMTGTPEELDKEFFANVRKPIDEANGLKVFLDSYKESVKKAAVKTEEKKPAPEKKQESKKSKSKSKDKKAAKTEEKKEVVQDIFANV